MSSGESLACGNDQVRDFDPGLALVDQPAERIEHRLQPPGAIVAIELVGEALQIDVGGVHRFVERRPGGLGDIAGGDRHGLDAQGMARLGRVDGVFRPDDRIVVGKGDAAAAEPRGGGGDGLGLGLFAGRLNVAAPRHGPILAELAAQVAARRAEREDRRAGIELVERFLFDRIDAEAGAAAVGGRNDRPSRFSRTKQKPRSPGLSAQCRGQRSQINRVPSSDSCHHMINFAARSADALR